MPEEIILDSSPEAAKPHTMEGWVSKGGMFFKEEDMARYDGCTHRACQYCGEPARKSWLNCDKCRSEKDVEKYKALPKEKWDGVCMLYSETEERYFSSPEEAQEFLDDEDGYEGKSLADLRLLLCDPQYAHEVDCDDYLQDVLPEDGYAPDFVKDAFEELNAKIRQWKKDGRNLSWFLGKTALLIDQP